MVPGIATLRVFYLFFVTNSIYYFWCQQTVTGCVYKGVVLYAQMLLLLPPLKYQFFPSPVH